MAEANEADEWDFYPCRVNDAPASILINFRYQDEERPEGKDTLYFAGLEILDPDDHGMGTAAEATALSALEDGIVASAEAAGLSYVGRVRNDGDWQLVFYGAAGADEALRDAVLRQLETEQSNRGYRLGSKADAEWKYYDEFLMPDAERFRWILNRRVVDQLRAAGDDLHTPRTVDHCVVFENGDGRRAFITAASALGFAVDPAAPGEDATRVELHREDSVDIARIHAVVSELEALAEQHGGEYDGWGTTVAPALPN